MSAGATSPGRIHPDAQAAYVLGEPREVRRAEAKHLIRLSGVAIGGRSRRRHHALFAGADADRASHLPVVDT